MKSFQDHFSQHSDRYRRYRPGYPASLFEWLASECEERRAAWDCGTGNGQAAIGLAEHFERVIATDASATQLAAAIPCERVQYRQAKAESSGLAGHSMDLVTVAQAAHWFNHTHFNREVTRVLKPGGLVAIWTYGLCSINDQVDPILQHFYGKVVGPFWPPERSHVASGYRSIPFPYRERQTPEMDIIASWVLADLLGYLSSWSATQLCRQKTGIDPVAEWHDNFLLAWGGDAATERTIRWPLHLRVGRVTESTTV